MPLGKDSIKRVRNNGYSRVTTSAPDMENSSIVEPIDLSVVVDDVSDVEAEQKATEPATKKKAEPKSEEPKPSEPKKEEPTPKKKPAPKKKSEPKPAPKKRTKSTKKPTPVSNTDIPTPTEVAETVAMRSGEGYINIGGELPIYLL